MYFTVHRPPLTHFWGWVNENSNPPNSEIQSERWIELVLSQNSRFNPARYNKLIHFLNRRLKRGMFPMRASDKIKIDELYEFFKNWEVGQVKKCFNRLQNWCWIPDHLTYGELHHFYQTCYGLHQLPTLSNVPWNPSISNPIKLAINSTNHQHCQTYSTVVYAKDHSELTTTAMIIIISHVIQRAESVKVPFRLVLSPFLILNP